MQSACLGLNIKHCEVAWVKVSVLVRTSRMAATVHLYHVYTRPHSCVHDLGGGMH